MKTFSLFPMGKKFNTKWVEMPTMMTTLSTATTSTMTTTTTITTKWIVSLLKPNEKLS